MSPETETQDSRDADLATLAWLIELGADEAIGDVPVNRLATPEDRGEHTDRPQKARSAVPPAQPVRPDTASIVADCKTLDALRTRLENFEDCALKKGARNTVFADGNPAARLMIVGEAPGRDEDRRGLPFVGRSGQLLDRMLAAIGLSRHAEAPEAAAYITNVLPWRPPQNRDPSADEIAMLLPFLHRHIEIVAPEVLVPMGNAASKTLLETKTGITRLRGTWTEWHGIPVLPMLHPAALLRDPEKKRAAWSDLLQIRHRLDSQA